MTISTKRRTEQTQLNTNDNSNFENPKFRHSEWIESLIEKKDGGGGGQTKSESIVPLVCVVQRSKRIVILCLVLFIFNFL